MSAPIIRFPSAEGEYRTIRIGDVCTWARNNSLSRDALTNEPGPVQNIHYGDIHTKFPTLFSQDEQKVPFISSDAMRIVKDEDFCRSGDLVIADASEDLTDVGKTIEIVHADPESLVAGLHTHLLRPNEGIFAPGYAGYMMRSPAVRVQIERAAQGTKVYGLSKKNISDIRVDIPSIPEQENIVSALSAVDKKINLLERQRDTLKRFKAGLMQQIFSQSVALPIDKDVKLGGGGGRSSTPEPRTRTARLGDIALRIRDGFVVDESGEIPPIVDLENIEAGTGRILGGLSSIRGSGVKHAFEAGDVLFGKLRPYLRKHAHPSFAGGCSTEIWVLRPSAPDLVPGYLYFMVQTDRFVEAANVSTGSRMPRAEWDLVSQIEFDIPCVTEQERIVQGLEAVDARIDLCARHKDILLRFRSGLVQRIFPQVSSL